MVNKGKSTAKLTSYEGACLRKFPAAVIRLHDTDIHGILDLTVKQTTLFVGVRRFAPEKVQHLKGEVRRSRAMGYCSACLPIDGRAWRHKDFAQCHERAEKAALRFETE